MADSYRSDEIKMIITKPARSIYDFRLDGVSFQNRKVSFIAGGCYSWAFDFNDYISKSDTVIKNKGELKFYIHKKDSILVFPFECDGVIYE
ncbi:hypothetical protein GCM10007390_03020 [Persicitalea jodogahamensis]|uniref:Uncharacterized protein n=1 Tax=Persicitalea jodogahamensis TaxID=402147 RepID=A0A8J3G7T7_9BACT|nr:hypothetical protein GCM10007390_03020 [Persicitalea jodogahamensis]